MTQNRISVHLVFTTVHVLLALATLIPVATASKACLLGYQALCSFTPISTIGLLALAGLHLYLHRKSAAKATTA